MLSRGLLFKILLGALAASAFLGVASIFMQSTLAWKVLGTSISLTCAAALLLPTAPTTTRGALTAYGRAMSTWVVGALALILAAIWLDYLRGANWMLDLFLVWLAVGAPALVVATPALKHRANADRSLWLAERISIVGSGTTLAVACAAQYLPGSAGLLRLDAIVLGFILLGGSCIAACCAIGLRAPSQSRFSVLRPVTRNERLLGSRGIALALVAVAAYEVHTWLMFAASGSTAWTRPEPLLEALGVTAAAFALPIGIWCFLGLSRDPSPLRYARHLAAVATLAVGLIYTYGVWEFALIGPYYNYFLNQLLWACVIVASSSLLAGVVMMRVHRARPIAGDAIEQLAWKCPRCGTKSTVGCGESPCAGCGLTVFIQFRDDRCPACAYDLRGAPAGATNCPECERARQMPA